MHCILAMGHKRCLLWITSRSMDVQKTVCSCWWSKGLNGHCFVDSGPKPHTLLALESIYLEQIGHMIIDKHEWWQYHLMCLETHDQAGAGTCSSNLDLFWHLKWPYLGIISNTLMDRNMGIFGGFSVYLASTDEVIKQAIKCFHFRWHHISEDWFSLSRGVWLLSSRQRLQPLLCLRVWRSLTRVLYRRIGLQRRSPDLRLAKVKYFLVVSELKYFVDVTLFLPRVTIPS